MALVSKLSVFDFFSLPEIFQVKRCIWLLSQWREEKRDFLRAAFLADVRKSLNGDQNETGASLIAPFQQSSRFDGIDWLNCQLINKN